MTLLDYLLIGRRWWWLIILGGILGGLGAFLITSRLTPTYSARAKLLVNQVQDPSGTSYTDIIANQSLTTTYAELATSSLNLDRAARSLNDPALTVDRLSRKVDASAVDKTQIIYITATDTSARRAALIADAVAKAFPDYIREAQLAGASESRLLNTVFVAEPARPNFSQVSPNDTLNVVVGIVLGLLVIVVIIALVEYLDDAVDEREDITAAGSPFLGFVMQVPTPKGVRADRWVPSIINSPQTPLAESFRQIQANLAFSLSARPSKVILITSSSPGEGKSTMAANLAEALAESSKKVLLIDGDLRKPDAHRYFSLPNASGLTSAFLAGTEVTPAFFGHIGYSLAVLTSGPIPPNPGELLSSPRLAAMLTALRDQFDIIIIDSPPLLGLADASLWLSLADGVILVARRGRTRRGAYESALAAIRSSSIPLIGTVLNGVDRRKSLVYDYPYGYAYGKHEEGQRGLFGRRKATSTSAPKKP